MIRDLFGKTLRMVDVSFNLLAQKYLMWAMLEQKQNPIKIGCSLILLGGVQGAMGAMSWADAATRGSIWAYFQK